MEHESVALRSMVACPTRRTGHPAREHTPPVTRASDHPACQPSGMRLYRWSWDSCDCTSRDGDDEVREGTRHCDRGCRRKVLLLDAGQRLCTPSCRLGCNPNLTRTHATRRPRKRRQSGAMTGCFSRLKGSVGFAIVQRKENLGPTGGAKSHQRMATPKTRNKRQAPTSPECCGRWDVGLEF